MRRVPARGVAASLALPVLLLAGMAVQAERALRDGVVIRVPITGYDPRDPLRGHFLRYRIAWNWLEGEPAVDVPALCVLSRADNPAVRPLTPKDGASCRLMLRLAPGHSPAFMPIGVPDELFIPEERAGVLQSVLRSGSALVTIDLAIARNGSAGIKDWHIDGKTMAEWSLPPAR